MRVALWSIMLAFNSFHLFCCISIVFEVTSVSPALRAGSSLPHRPIGYSKHLSLALCLLAFLAYFVVSRRCSKPHQLHRCAAIASGPGPLAALVRVEPTDSPTSLSHRPLPMTRRSTAPPALPAHASRPQRPACRRRAPPSTAAPAAAMPAAPITPHRGPQQQTSPHPHHGPKAPRERQPLTNHTRVITRTCTRVTTRHHLPT